MHLLSGARARHIAAVWRRPGKEVKVPASATVTVQVQVAATTTPSEWQP